MGCRKPRGPQDGRLVGRDCRLGWPGEVSGSGSLAELANCSGFNLGSNQRRHPAAAASGFAGPSLRPRSAPALSLL